MDRDHVRQVRSFNRTVTQRIGALTDDFLDRGRPLGASRLLHEIGRGGAEVRELRARLDLDSGYVSRLLRALERQGLVRGDASPRDARVRRVTLTPKGRPRSPSSIAAPTPSRHPFSRRSARRSARA